MNLIERDKKVIWHPFTPQKNMPLPVGITHAKNTLLYDEEGKEYIDAISSWWVTIHGHANEYIAQRLYQQALQLEQVIFAGFTHEPAVALAEQLLPILPGEFARIFYSDNGSTSTEVAIKMSLQYWWNKYDYAIQSVNPLHTKRTTILAFNNAYHGDTFGAMSVSDRSVFTKPFQGLLFDVLFIDTPNKDNIHQLKHTIAAHKDHLAAFIYEPLVQGAGGLIMYESSLLDELLNTCKEHHIICIADEVMTGFGRTGKLFASNYLQNKPDIICLSKGLTGGTLPLGVTACTAEIYNAYLSDDKLKTFFHGHSFTANPLSCTAALASLELLLKDDKQVAMKNIGSNHLAFAAHLKTYTPKIKNIRCLGTILAFEINEGNDEYLNDIAQKVTTYCMERGVYLRPLGNTVYLMPPYCITKDELQTVYSVLESLLQQL
jgi:adenosylmethionine---8-amino-7-oxononanoate aminotransferase